jgi:beta-glucosidase
MTAHNTVLNRPCHANPYLVNDILRTEFGFGDGIIISDCNDIEALVSFRVAEDMPHAAAKGLLGGVDWDLQCGGSSAYTSLGDALAANLVNESTIELAAKRSLMEKFAVGLFDSPYTSDGGISALNSLANQKLALRAAEEGVVLLKNTRNVLPLPAGKPLKIAVIVSTTWARTQTGIPLATSRCLPSSKVSFNTTLRPPSRCRCSLVRVHPSMQTICP